MDLQRGREFDQFLAVLDRLCQRFAKYRPEYRKGLDEYSLRNEYLDPFFEALGWDVRNTKDDPPFMRDVRVEYRAYDGVINGKADYVFRIGGFDRFVCEAKKFPEKLENHRFQLQNYVYNLRLWIGLTTNFDELNLFVVGGKPSREKPFSVVPGWRLCYQDYRDAAPKIWDLLSRQAVAAGSLEAFIQNLPKVTSRTDRQLWLIKPDRNRAVDTDFLQYLEGERARLAKSLIRHNAALHWDVESINEAVQVILDRLIFQRVCEDRDIDTFQTLRQALSLWERHGRRKGELWTVIVGNQANMRAAFNGGLYGRAGAPAHFVESCVVDDRWLADFIDHLAGDESPYLFSTLPIEILGSVYERFLGSVIDEQGNVTPKPEIRKQGGVFYTPEHIVAHIVDGALAPLLDGKTPEQMRRIRILDPACGSGTFLIRALEKLFQAHIHYYHLNVDKRDGKSVYLDAHGDLKLTSEPKKRIAKDCIFGVDIDRQATEVSEMSIYLKILEGETQSTLGRQRVLFPNETFLPDLTGNIHVGNSLVGQDAYALLPAGLRITEAKPFSWELSFPAVRARGWFDAVIGNPPYDVIEKERGAASWPHDVFRAYLARTDRLDAAKGGKLNLFRFFLIQSLQLVRHNGSLGMIVPMALLADFSCKTTRLAVLDQVDELNARAFPQKDIRQHRVFYDAKLSTVVVGGRKRPPSRRKHNPRISLHVYPRASFDDPSRDVTMRRSELAAIDPLGLPIPITDQASWELAKKLHQANSVARLDGIAGIRIARGEINQTIYRAYITDDPRHSGLLKGVEVSAYAIHRTLSQGRVEWFDRARYEQAHITPDAVGVRRIATQRITGVDERHRIVATLSEPGWYFADSTNAVVVAPTCDLSPEYILACLNSRLLQWRFQLTSSNNNVGTNELAALPIKLLDLGDAGEARTHAAIVAQVGHLMQLGARLNANPSVKVRAEAIERFREVRSGLDRTIETLYSLTTDEAALVHRRFAAPP
jgi:hypothetical protein